MRRLLLLFFSLLFLGASSYSQLSYGIGAQLGTSFSSFPTWINDIYGNGYGVGAHGDMNILKYLTAKLSADYWTFSSDKNKIIGIYVAANPGTMASDFSFEGFNTSIFSICGSGVAKIPLGGVITPYGLAGVGVNFINTGEGKVTYLGTAQPQANVPSSSETDFGLNFGGGVEFGVPFGWLFAEIKYVIIFTDVENSSHVPVVVGLTVGL